MKQAHSEADLPRIAIQVENQGLAYVKQQNSSFEKLIHENNEIIRMGMLANQFTALSARGFK